MEKTYAELLALYGAKVIAGCDVVEVEYPDESGTWYNADPEHTPVVVYRYIARGCRVWVNGVPAVEALSARPRLVEPS